MEWYYILDKQPNAGDSILQFDRPYYIEDGNKIFSSKYLIGYRVWEDHKIPNGMTYVEYWKDFVEKSGWGMPDFYWTHFDKNCIPEDYKE